MPWSPTTPITGAAQTGFTSPTYTISADTYPGVNGKQHAITALGGTQVGVRSHSVSDPFTVSAGRPTSLRSLPAVNGNGGYSSVPRNTYFIITRKGVNIAANQPPVTLLASTKVEVPAGADSYDSANVRAALSCHFGAIAQQSAGFGDLCVSGVL